MTDSKNVRIARTGNYQEGDLYSEEGDGKVYELKNDVATTADGHPYVCFRLEPVKGMAHVKLPQRPPRIFVDSHMHIQSSHCSPLLFLREQAFGIPLTRPQIKNTATVLGLFTDYTVVGAAVKRGLNWKNGTEDEKGNYPQKLAIADLSKQSEPSTYQIGLDFIKKLEKLTDDFHDEKPYRQAKDLAAMGVVMTMDMEYAHLSGYYGIKIYNPIYADKDDLKNEVEPKGYWYPRWRNEIFGGVIKKEAKQAPDNYREQGETTQEHEALTRSRQTEGVQGYVSGEDGEITKTVYLDGEMCEAPKSEVRGYETWKKQLRHTKQVAIDGKLKLLPMFHYDPRRWQGNRKMDEAFVEVGERKGIFLGFKMYTAQGYRPWDPRLPNLAKFYTKCCEGPGIPILCHCNSEGASTFDREDYINHVHPKDTDYDEKQKLTSAAWWYKQPFCDGEISVSHQKDLVPGQGVIPTKYTKQEVVEILSRKKAIDEDRRQDVIAELKNKTINDFINGGDIPIGYFKDNFVSPYAWRIVLDKHPTLRLCLAHFGGNKEVERVWCKEIAQMMGEKDGKGDPKYPNLYADISYSFASKDFQEHFKKLLEENPHIKERTLFGTDWFLAVLEGKDYPAYCKTAKKFLDDIDKNLWTKFTQDNPNRFYRIGGQIGRIKDNLKKERQNEVSQKASDSKNWNPKQGKSPVETPREDPKTYSDEIDKKARLIQWVTTMFVPLPSGGL